MHTATLHQRPGEDTGDGTQAKTIARYSLCWTPSSSAFERRCASGDQSGGLDDVYGHQKVLWNVFRRCSRACSEGPPYGLQKVFNVAPQLVLRRCEQRRTKS